MSVKTYYDIAGDFMTVDTDDGILSLNINDGLEVVFETEDALRLIKQLNKFVADKLKTGE